MRASSVSRERIRLLLGGSEVSRGIHPLGGSLQPAIDGELRLAGAEAVTAFGVNMNFRREVLALVGEVEFGGFNGVIAVVMSNHEEAGRGIRGHAHAFGEVLLGFFVEEAATIDKEREVRTTGIIDPVFLGIGAGGAIPGSVAYEIGSGRKADDADALWIYIPLRRTMADDAECTLQVLDGIVGRHGFIGRGCAVAQENARDADAVEPFANARAFIRRGEEPVTAARADDDGGAIGVGGGVDGDRRFGDIRLVASVATFGPDAIGGRFGWCHASPGNALGPQGDGVFGSACGSREGQEEEREESHRGKDKTAHHRRCAKHRRGRVAASFRED